MANQVVSTAQLQCTFGAAPAVLNVLPNTVTIEGRPAATIADMVPMTNIPSFGMCSAPSNPAVISATSAASGVFTPAPCVPATAAPWAPGAPTVLIGGKPALNSNSKCNCAWGGIISITVPGATKTQVP
jgi:uncharacterized Zn-binding protein involved in type VI secretion